MEVVKNEQIVCVDVDDTLVIWSDHFTQPHVNSQTFIDPYDNSVNYLIPHQQHIDLIKKYKGRGFFIIVWSAGGVRWAESVVKTLGLENYVDKVMTKPAKYVDDLSCDKWMGNKVYIPFKEIKDGNQ